MKRITYSMIVLLLTMAFSFSLKAQTCPATCSNDLTDCFSAVPYCPTASCTGSFKVPNTVLTKSGSTVTVGRIDICYMLGGTPPWTSTLVVGRLMNISLRPSATRTFNTTASTGATFQCTVESNGMWSIKMISGTAPGSGTTLTGGSYTL